MRSPHLHRRGLLARALRAAYAVVLAVVALAALLVGGAWTLLQSRWGSDVIRRIAVRRVNAAISGRLAIGRLSFSGNRLAFASVELYDPEGRPALSFDRAEIAISPAALLRGRLETTAVAIRRPRVVLIQDRDGLGIARAFTPRGPTRPPPQGPPSRHPTIEVRGFTIVGGAVEYRRGERGPRARVDELAVTGMLRIADALELGVAVHRPGLDLAGHWTLDLAHANGASAFDATLRAIVPGTTVTGRGRMSADGIDAAVSLDASDLAATSKTLAPFIGGGPELGGQGRVDVRLSGPSGRPALRIAVRAPAITIGEAHARELRATATVPDLRLPSKLELEVAAASARLGSRRLTSPSASVHATGARVAARVRAQLPTPVELALDGQRERASASGIALAIERLELLYPGAHWSLRHPAAVRVDTGRVSLSGLALADGSQRLEADFAQKGKGLGGQLTVSALDLGRLAPLLAPDGPTVGGVLDGRIRLQGSGRAPTVDARLALARGKIGRLEGLTVGLDAHAAGGRLRGRIDAKAIGVAATSHFDAPARWPLPRSRAPLDVDVEVAETDLARAAPAAAAAAPGVHLPPLRGRVRLHARLAGTCAAPTLALETGARGLVVADRPVGDLSLAVKGDRAEPLDLHLTATGLAGAPGARAQVALRAPLSLADLLGGSLVPARPATMPLAASAEVTAFPISALAQLWPSLPTVRGTIAAKLDASGTLGDPKGTVHLQVAGASGDGFPATDAEVDARLDPRETSADVRVTRRGRTMLEAKGHLAAGGRALGDPGTLAAAPLDVRATIGPLTVRRRGLPSGRLHTDTGTLTADVQAELTVAGTARAPRINVRAEGRDVKLDELGVGAGRVEATYADRRAAIDANLTSANGGSLRAHLAAKADLGDLPSLHRLALDRTPFDLTFEADRLDLRALSGVVPEVRAVAGLVDARVEGHGTVAAPHLAGRLEWHEGALTLSGFGEYRDIHLAVHGDEQRITLDDLTAKSGDGKAHVTGTAERLSDGYRLAAQSDVSRFRLYNEGQALGRLSLDAKLSGTATAGRTELTTEIKNAKVELADIERRNLQSLQLPRDVVLVENGRPKGREQAEKLRAIEDRLAARLAGAQRGSPAAPPHPPHAHLVITVQVGDRVWVNGKDAKLELSVEPGMRVVIGRTTHLYGTVTVRRGRVDVLGRRFDIHADSSVRWNGPPDRPDLDVEAQYDNSNEGVSVIVTIKGSPGNMDVSVRSPNRPELTSSQLYALIVSGHLDTGTGQAGTEPFSATTEAASLVGGLLATGIQSTLGNRLPLDVFTIDTGSGAGLTGTQLEAGRYVTDRLYVGYIGRIGADPSRYQNRNAVHAEYRLTSRWQIEGEYGDVGTGSADAVWKKNY